jgi:hypothetical protein
MNMLLVSHEILIHVVCPSYAVTGSVRFSVCKRKGTVVYGSKFCVSLIYPVNPVPDIGSFVGYFSSDQ